MPSRRRAGTTTLLVLVALAGCAGFLGGADDPQETVTPAPVPGPTDAHPADTSRTPTPGRADGDTGNGTAGYAALQPTCTRPPGLVVSIQVAALSNNGPADEGIRTAWRFAAPSNREVTGPYANFRRLINTSYRPLLEARTVTYGPVNRTGRSAERTVSLTTAAGNSTTYRWRLDRQSGGQYDGCWMTSGVRELDASTAG
jgi:hypothetical protein